MSGFNRNLDAGLFAIATAINKTHMLNYFHLSRNQLYLMPDFCAHLVERKAAAFANLFRFRQPVFDSFDRQIFGNWSPPRLFALVGDALPDLFLNRPRFGDCLCFVKQFPLRVDAALAGCAELLVPREVKLFFKPAHLRFQLFDGSRLLVDQVQQFLFGLCRRAR
jgi:hypothetical protein